MTLYTYFVSKRSRATADRQRQRCVLFLSSRQLFFASVLSLAACTPASAEPPFYGLGKSKHGDYLMAGTREVQLFT